MDKNEALKEMGKRVRTYRIKAELSQQELADKVGYTSRAMICKIENGTTDLSQSKLKKLAEALNVSPSDIMNVRDIVIDYSLDEKMFIETYRNSSIEARMSAYAELLKGIKKNDN